MRKNFRTVCIKISLISLLSNLLMGTPLHVTALNADIKIISAPTNLISTTNEISWDDNEVGVTLSATNNTGDESVTKSFTYLIELTKIPAPCGVAPTRIGEIIYATSAANVGDTCKVIVNTIVGSDISSETYSAVPPVSKIFTIVKSKSIAPTPSINNKQSNYPRNANVLISTEKPIDTQAPYSPQYSILTLSPIGSDACKLTQVNYIHADINDLARQGEMVSCLISVRNTSNWYSSSSDTITKVFNFNAGGQWFNEIVLNNDNPKVGSILTADLIDVYQPVVPVPITFKWYAIDTLTSSQTLLYSVTGNDEESNYLVSSLALGKVIRVESTIGDYELTSYTAATTTENVVIGMQELNQINLRSNVTFSPTQYVYANSLSLNSGTVINYGFSDELIKWNLKQKSLDPDKQVALAISIKTSLDGINWTNYFKEKELTNGFNIQNLPQIAQTSDPENIDSQVLPELTSKDISQVSQNYPNSITLDSEFSGKYLQIILALVNPGDIFEAKYSFAPVIPLTDAKVFQSYYKLFEKPTTLTFAGTPQVNEIPTLYLPNANYQLSSFGISDTDTLVTYHLAFNSAGCTINNSDLSATTSGLCSVYVSYAKAGYVTKSSAIAVVRVNLPIIAGTPIINVPRTLYLPSDGEVLSISGMTESGTSITYLIESNTAGCEVSNSLLTAKQVGVCYLSVTVSKTGFTDITSAPFRLQIKTFSPYPVFNLNVSIGETYTYTATQLQQIYNALSIESLNAIFILDTSNANLAHCTLDNYHRLFAAAAGSCIIYAVNKLNVSPIQSIENSGGKVFSSGQLLIDSSQAFATIYITSVYPNRETLTLSADTITRNYLLPINLAITGYSDTASILNFNIESNTSSCWIENLQVQATKSGICQISFSIMRDGFSIKKSNLLTLNFTGFTFVETKTLRQPAKLTWPKAKVSIQNSNTESNTSVRWKVASLTPSATCHFDDNYQSIELSGPGKCLINASFERPGYNSVFSSVIFSVESATFFDTPSITKFVDSSTYPNLEQWLLVPPSPIADTIIGLVVETNTANCTYSGDSIFNIKAARGGYCVLRAVYSKYGFYTSYSQAMTLNFNNLNIKSNYRFDTSTIAIGTRFSSFTPVVLGITETNISVSYFFETNTANCQFENDIVIASALGICYIKAKLTKPGYNDVITAAKRIEIYGVIDGVPMVRQVARTLLGTRALLTMSGVNEPNVNSFFLTIDQYNNFYLSQPPAANPNCEVYNTILVITYRVGTCKIVAIVEKPGYKTSVSEIMEFNIFSPNLMQNMPNNLEIRTPNITWPNRSTKLQILNWDLIPDTITYTVLTSEPNVANCVIDKDILSISKFGFCYIAAKVAKVGYYDKELPFVLFEAELGRISDSKTLFTDTNSILVSRDVANLHLTYFNETDTTLSYILETNTAACYIISNTISAKHSGRCSVYALVNKLGFYQFKSNSVDLNFYDAIFTITPNLVALNQFIARSEVVSLSISEISDLNINIAYEIESNTAGCTIVGNLLTATKYGICNVRATVSKDGYMPISTPSFSIRVLANIFGASLKLETPAMQLFADSVVTKYITESTTPFIQPTINLVGNCTLISNRIVSSATGDCTVTAVWTANNYATETRVAAFHTSSEVIKKSQPTFFAPHANFISWDESMTLNAQNLTESSVARFTYSSITPTVCFINYLSGRLSVFPDVNIGSICSVRVNTFLNGNYNSVADTITSTVVTKSRAKVTHPQILKVYELPRLSSYKLQVLSNNSKNLNHNFNYSIKTTQPVDSNACMIESGVAWAVVDTFTKASQAVTCEVQVAEVDNLWFSQSSDYSSPIQITFEQGNSISLLTLNHNVAQYSTPIIATPLALTGPDTSTISYKWSVSLYPNSNFVEIPGANTNKYVPIESDIGKYLKVESRFGSGPNSVSSFTTTQVPVAPKQLSGGAVHVVTPHTVFPSVQSTLIFDPLNETQVERKLVISNINECWILNDAIIRANPGRCEFSVRYSKIGFTDLITDTYTFVVDMGVITGPQIQLPSSVVALVDGVASAKFTYTSSQQSITPIFTVSGNGCYLSELEVTAFNTGTCILKAYWAAPGFDNVTRTATISVVNQLPTPNGGGTNGTGGNPSSAPVDTPIALKSFVSDDLIFVGATSVFPQSITLNAKVSDAVSKIDHTIEYKLSSVACSISNNSLNFLNTSANANSSSCEVIATLSAPGYTPIISKAVFIATPPAIVAPPITTKPTPIITPPIKTTPSVTSKPITKPVVPPTLEMSGYTTKTVIPTKSVLLYVAKNVAKIGTSVLVYLRVKSTTTLATAVKAIKMSGKYKYVTATKLSGSTTAACKKIKTTCYGIVIKK